MFIPPCSIQTTDTSMTTSIMTTDTMTTSACVYVRTSSDQPPELIGPGFLARSIKQARTVEFLND